MSKNKKIKYLKTLLDILEEKLNIIIEYNEIEVIDYSNTLILWNVPIGHTDINNYNIDIYLLVYSYIAGNYTAVEIKVSYIKKDWKSNKYITEYKDKLIFKKRVIRVERKLKKYENEYSYDHLIEEIEFLFSEEFYKFLVKYLNEVN